jgi:hypothetical protein
MEFIGFAIAMAVAYQALKGYKLSRERTLLYLHLSFVLLGTGLLVDGLASLIALRAKLLAGFLVLYAIGYAVNFLAQLLAYGILAFAYFRQTRSLASQSLAATAVLSALFFERNAIAEFILAILLVYITTQATMNYSVSKSRNSLLVVGAFASLMLAHFFFMAFIVIPIFFPLAHIAQLFGFLLLLAMLLRVNQPS